MFQGLKKIHTYKNIVVSSYFVPIGLFIVFAVTFLVQLLISLPIALLFLIGDSTPLQEYGWFVVVIFAVNSLVLTGFVSLLVVPLQKFIKKMVSKFGNWM